MAAGARRPAGSPGVGTSPGAGPSDQAGSARRGPGMNRKTGPRPSRTTEPDRTGQGPAGCRWPAVGHPGRAPTGEATGRPVATAPGSTARSTERAGSRRGVALIVTGRTGAAAAGAAVSENHTALPGPSGRSRAPGLAQRRHQGEPATAGLQRLRPRLVDDRQPRIAVDDRDRESPEPEFDLHGAGLVRLRVAVHVAEQFRHAERSPVYERIQFPVAQLRRNDSADLADPRRQGLQFDDAVPAGMTDHGCDSPT